MKPHLHREAIIAWADGARIQYRYKDGPWIDCIHIPEWKFDHEYRAKPERKYPTTRMMPADFKEAARLAALMSAPFADHPAEVFNSIANAALRHACNAGQVVPREEFDLALADREARDAAIASAAIHEAATVIESMGMGLNVFLVDMLAVAAEKVRSTSIMAIVDKAVA